MAGRELLLILFVAPVPFALGVGLYGGYVLAIGAKARAWQREEHALIEARARELMLRDPDATVSFERLAGTTNCLDEGRHPIFSLTPPLMRK